MRCSRAASVVAIAIHLSREIIGIGANVNLLVASVNIIPAPARIQQLCGAYDTGFPLILRERRLTKPSANANEERSVSLHAGAGTRASAPARAWRPRGCSSCADRS